MTDPAPLTPPDCDLRAFRDMPLDIGRFRRSDLVTEEDPEAVLAAILLWGAAWHEVPAASVPDNDRWLAKAAGYGRAVDSWLRVREGALRGFIRCDDGRLYNRTLAEKANVAWEARQKHQWQKAAERHRKAQRDLPEEERTRFPPFEDWLASGGMPVTSDELRRSGGQDDLFRRKDDEFRRNEGENPASGPLKGREGKGMESSVDADASTPRAFAVPPDALKAFRAHRQRLRKPMTPRAEELIVITLERIHREHGHDPTAVLDQSIMHGWTGVFPLKDEQNGRGNRNGSGAGDKRSGLARELDERMGHG